MKLNSEGRLEYVNEKRNKKIKVVIIALVPLLNLLFSSMFSDLFEENQRNCKKIST